MKPLQACLLPLAVLLAIGAGACNPQSAPEQIAFDGAGDTNRAKQLAHGERLTVVLGCHGCHAEGMLGQKWDDDPAGYGVMWASNLTRSIPTMSDAQVLAVLQQGKHPSRANLWIMPSELFQHLSPADSAAVLAYLRTLKPQGELSPPPILGPKAHQEIANGTIRPAAVLVRETRDTLPADLGPKFTLGRYISAVTCAECHGLKLEGSEGGPPNLIVASAYSRPEFELLLTQGQAPHGRKINPLMTSVGKRRYSRMTPHERDELYAYLVARAALPQ